MNNEDEILNVMQAATLLQIKKTKMYRLIKSPAGPKFTKIGRRWLILKSCLLQWIFDHAGKENVM